MFAPYTTASSFLLFLPAVLLLAISSSQTCVQEKGSSASLESAPHTQLPSQSSNLFFFPRRLSLRFFEKKDGQARHCVLAESSFILGLCPRCRHLRGATRVYARHPYTWGNTRSRASICPHLRVHPARVYMCMRVWYVSVSACLCRVSAYASWCMWRLLYANARNCTRVRVGAMYVFRDASARGNLSTCIGFLPRSFTVLKAEGLFFSPSVYMPVCVISVYGVFWWRQPGQERRGPSLCPLQIGCPVWREGRLCH